jgi:hypothetical protein
MAPGSTARAPRPTAVSLIADFEKLTKELADAPYGDLPKLVHERGWVIYLNEKSVTPTGFGTVLATYDIMVGKRPIAEGDPELALERIDSVTMNLAGNTLPVSFAARKFAIPTLLYMLLGREQPLPPAPPAEAAAPNGALHPAHEAPGIDAHDRDVTVQEDLPLKADPILVANTTPDGLPLFDLYSHGEQPAVILEALKRTLTDEVAKIGTDEGLQSLAKLNLEQINDFIGDFFPGEAGEREIAAIQGIFNLRQAEILRARAGARRRAPATH